MTFLLVARLLSTIERLCRQAGVSRAGYYRSLGGPARRARTTPRCATPSSVWRWRNGRHRGYRLVTFQLRREGMIVNHKRVLRLMRAGQPAVPAAAAFCAAHDRLRATPGTVVPNLARGMRAERPRPAVGGRHHLHPPAGGVRLPRRRARRLQPARDRLGDGRRRRGNRAAVSYMVELNPGYELSASCLRLLAAWIRPRFAFFFALLEIEGAGKTGCLLHPRSVCNLSEQNAHTSIQGSGSIPAFPAQWLYGLLRALPGERLFCLRRPREILPGT